MKKANNNPKNEDMLPEYNFKGKRGVRGKYAKAMQQGYSVRILNADGSVKTTQHYISKESAIVLDPDVSVFFPDSKSVNRALRTLIELIPVKREKRVAEKKTRYKPK
jgi:hypothetical protein